MSTETSPMDVNEPGDEKSPGTRICAQSEPANAARKKNPAVRPVRQGGMPQVVTGGAAAGKKIPRNGLMFWG